MGIIRMGPPTEIIEALWNNNPNITECLVETGTMSGDTASWAAKHFKKVYTIEKSEELFKRTKKRYGHLNNISFIQGDSKACLPLIINNLTHPSVFWLDAHWSGPGSCGLGNECPLLEEIEIVNKNDGYIFIDDARLFLSPPPSPCDMTQWPNICSVIDVLRKEGEKSINIIEDVIISVPKKDEHLIRNICQKINTRAWVNR